MEIHSVLPEERARTQKGEVLPWAYRYADSAKNTRQPEESGPFGRNRSIRYTSSSRRASTRQGTTPVRQKENSAVSDFSRLLAVEQAANPDRPIQTAEPGSVPPQSVPTECLLYGYASRNSEWKVISRYEQIVQPSIICEDYSRQDPNLIHSSNSPLAFSRSAMVTHKDLSRDALQKSRVYKGGKHWIKVTFDSWEAAQKACFYSPVEIDGYLVYCEEWQGKGPLTDAPIPKGAEAAGDLVSTSRARTMGPATGKASAVAGFEQAAFSTLPRSHTLPDVQFRQPPRDDIELDSSTASSATATGPSPAAGLVVPDAGSSLRSRSVPHLPSQVSDPTSQYMSRNPKIKKAMLRPASEALPPRQSLIERILRGIPIISWLFGPGSTAKKDGKAIGGLVGEGPVLKDDGTWDSNANGWYWDFWHKVDKIVGSDYCGLRDD